MAMQPVDMDIPEGEEVVLDLGSRIVKLAPAQFSAVITALEDRKTAWLHTIRTHRQMAEEPLSRNEKRLNDAVLRYAEARITEIDALMLHFHKSGFEGQTNA